MQVEIPDPNNEAAAARPHDDVQTLLIRSLPRTSLFRRKPRYKPVERVCLSWQSLPDIKMPVAEAKAFVDCSSRYTSRLSGFDFRGSGKSSNLTRFQSNQLNRMFVSHYRHSNLKGGQFSYHWSYNPDGGNKKNDVSIFQGTGASLRPIPVSLGAACDSKMEFVVNNSCLLHVMDVKKGFTVTYNHKAQAFRFRYIWHDRPLESCYVMLSKLLIRVPSMQPRDILLCFLNSSEFGPNTSIFAVGNSHFPRQTLLEALLNHLEDKYRCDAEDLLLSGQSSQALLVVLSGLLDQKLDWWTHFEEWMLIPMESRTESASDSSLLSKLRKERDYLASIKKLKSDIGSYLNPSPTPEPQGQTGEQVPAKRSRQIVIQQPKLLTIEEMQDYVKQFRTGSHWGQPPEPDDTDSVESAPVLNTDQILEQKPVENTEPVQPDEGKILNASPSFAACSATTCEELVERARQALSRPKSALKHLSQLLGTKPTPDYLRFVREEVERSSWHSQQDAGETSVDDISKLGFCHQIIRAGLSFIGEWAYFDHSSVHEDNTKISESKEHYAHDNSPPDWLFSMRRLSDSKIQLPLQTAARYEDRFAVWYSGQMFIVRKHLHENQYSVCVVHNSGALKTVATYGKPRSGNFLYCAGRILEPYGTTTEQAGSLVINLRTVKETQLAQVFVSSTHFDGNLVLQKSGKPNFIASMGPTTAHFLMWVAKKRLIFGSSYYPSDLHKRQDKTLDVSAKLAFLTARNGTRRFHIDLLNISTFEAQQVVVITQIIPGDRAKLISNLIPIKPQGQFLDKITSDILELGPLACNSSEIVGSSGSDRMRPKLVAHSNMVFILINPAHDDFRVFVVKDLRTSPVSVVTSAILRNRFREAEPHSDVPQFPCLMNPNRDLLVRKKRNSLWDYELGCITIKIRS